MRKLALLLLTSSLMISCPDYRMLFIEYRAEKEFYKAKKQMDNFLLNPEIVSQEYFKETVSKFQNIINRYTGLQSKSERIKRIVENSWLSIPTLHFYRHEDIKARKVYDKIISLNATNQVLCAQAQYLKALSYERANQFNKAYLEYKFFLSNYKDLLESPIYSNPNYLEIPLKIARMARLLKKNNVPEQYRKSRQLYFDLIKSHHNNQTISSIYHLIAITYSDIQNWEKAVNILKSFIIDYPDSTREPFIRFEIANLYDSQLKQPDVALRIYRDMITKYPNHHLNPNILVNIGNIYLELHDYAKARIYFKKVIAEYTTNMLACAKAQFGIGFTYEKENRLEKAINEYKWVITKYPLTLEALIVPNYIGKYYRRSNLQKLSLKSFQNAVKQYQNFIQAYPRNRLVSVAYFQLALAYENLNEWDKAIDAAEKIITDYSVNNTLLPEAYVIIGEIYEKKLNKKEKAIQFFKAFKERFPMHPYINEIDQKIMDLKE